MTLKIALAYLALGILVSFLFELFTGRIKRNMTQGVITAQSAFGTGYRTTIALLIVSTIVLWPALIIGAITKYGGKSES